MRISDWSSDVCSSDLPDRMVSLLDSLGTARVFDLGRPLQRGMPQSPNHPPFQMILERRHGDRCRPGDTSAANEIIITGGHVGTHVDALSRSEEHTSELQSLMRISYAVFCLKQTKTIKHNH